MGAEDENAKRERERCMNNLQVQLVLGSDTEMFRAPVALLELHSSFTDFYFRPVKISLSGSYGVLPKCQGQVLKKV